MKRALCACIVLLLLLSGCSAPQTETPPTGELTYGIYEFTFNVKRLSGWPFDDWAFVYEYGGEQITSGHKIEFSLELFAFHSIQVDIIEKSDPKNVYSATFPVAICDGGSGETEVTVTGRGGLAVTYRITCQVTQVGRR